MKRKAIILLFMLVTVFIADLPFQAAAVRASGNDVKIPDEAIRLRILADSNSERDQNVKRHVRDAVNAEVAAWVSDLGTIDEARDMIADHLADVEQTVHETLEDLDVRQTVTIKFGDVQFPTKMYGNHVYPAGTYEALRITLGDGQGANWWCVLFPPLCFLDFDNGDAVEPEAAPEDQEKPDSNEDVEVKFFIVEWFTSLIDTIVDFFTGWFSS